MGKTWTWAFIGSVAKFDVERIIEICKATGVRALEYGVGGADGLREQELKEVRERYTQAGIAVNSFHLPFATDDDIASFYETQRRAAVQRMIRWIGVAGHGRQGSDPAPDHQSLPGGGQWTQPIPRPTAKEHRGTAPRRQGSRRRHRT